MYKFKVDHATLDHGLKLFFITTKGQRLEVCFQTCQGNAVPTVVQQSRWAKPKLEGNPPILFLAIYTTHTE